MNTFLVTAFHFIVIFGIGSLIGLGVSIFTIILMRRLAKRAELYRPTYIPMTLVESKMWKCVLIAYPLLFGIVLSIIWAFKLLK
jgi:hypothetical protein